MLRASVPYAVAMQSTVDWDDVQRFVSAYVEARRKGGGGARRSTNLLDEITDAYLAERELPASMRTEVIAMVDSVL